MCLSKSAVRYQGGVGGGREGGMEGWLGPRVTWTGEVKGSEVASRGAETGQGRLQPLPRAHLLFPGLLVEPAVCLQQVTVSSGLPFLSL